MSQFPEYDAARIRRYSAIFGGLLIFIVLLALHWLLDWIGLPMEHEWEHVVLSGALGGGAYPLAQIPAKWFVQRYPTTSAFYD